MAITLGEHESGAVVYRVTDDSLWKSNIYCEIPWCSADSRFFVFNQMDRERGPESTEYMICEFGTWETQRLDTGLGRTSGNTMSHDGRFYFCRAAEGKPEEVVRIDLGTQESQVIYELPEATPSRRRIAVSRDERYLIIGYALSYDPQMFGVDLVDLEDGSHELITKDPDICNPHLQFEPGEGRQFLVQHNRGSKWLSDGTWAVRKGPEGNTIFTVDVPGGEITRLQLGPPYTTGTTGHEAWIGDTKEILVSVQPTDDYAAEKGNLLGVRAGAPPRVVSKGYEFMHVGTSVCGRFFSCDESGRANPDNSGIIIGSTRTGENAVVCESHDTPSRGNDEPEGFMAQAHHCHPYLSPDLQWVVFNSNRTGEPQIHVASMPPGLTDELERGEAA